MQAHVAVSSASYIKSQIQFLQTWITAVVIEIIQLQCSSNCNNLIQQNTEVYWVCVARFW